MTRRRYPESVLLQQVVKALRVTLRPQATFFHVPNERESGKQRRILAACGVLPGVADLIILAPYPIPAAGPLQRMSRGPTQWVGRAYAIELKAGRNPQTTAQKGFESMCEEAAVPYRVCRSVDEVLEALEDWGLMRPGVHIERRTAG